MISSTYPTLEHAVSGERKSVSGQAGPLSYYVSGSSTPALILHSINAAGSVAEMAPTYDHLRTTHQVYAPDLPGFGFSDRSARTYDIELYVTAIEDMLQVIARDHGDLPVDAIALSLSSEFLARAAKMLPERFRSLTFITPTGFRKGSEKLTAADGATRYMPLLDSILTFKLWRTPLYNLLVRPGTIRYFLRRTYGSSDIDEELAKYCDVTTHQPGAEHAPYAFLSGALFGKDIRRVYESLNMPVFVPHGTRGDFADFRGADWTEGRDNWTLKAYPAGAMPQWEVADKFHQDLDQFMEGNL